MQSRGQNSAARYPEKCGNRVKLFFKKCGNRETRDDGHVLTGCAMPCSDEGGGDFMAEWRRFFKGYIGCAGGHGRAALPHEMLRKGKNSLIKV